jgi:hypothetical protein
VVSEWVAAGWPGFVRTRGGDDAAVAQLAGARSVGGQRHERAKEDEQHFFMGLLRVMQSWPGRGVNGVGAADEVGDAAAAAASTTCSRKCGATKSTMRV